MEELEYIQEYRILICCRCKVAITLCRLRAHLQGPSHLINRADIKHVFQWAAELNIVNGPHEIAQLQFPPDTAKPLPQLGDPKQGGFRCTFTSECPFVGTALRRVREHLRQIHSWDQRLKGGRRTTHSSAREQQESPWRSGVQYQRFFPSGPRSENFEVGRESSKGTKSAGSGPGTEKDAFTAFQANSKRIRLDEQQSIIAQGDFEAPNPWLRRLGAATHLKDFSGKKELLRSLLSVECQVDGQGAQAVDERPLLYIHEAIEQCISRGQTVTRAEIVSWNTLFEVNRKELDQERSRPFHFRFNTQTKEKYTKVCKQLFSFLVRTEDLDERPPYILTKSQVSIREQLLDNAEGLVEALDEHAAQGGGGEQEIKALQEALARDVQQMYISIIDHMIKGSEYNSVLISFLMVLALRTDDTWESYGNFTPKLSGIMAISRLFIVLHAFEETERDVRSLVETGIDRSVAEERLPTCFDRVSEMTRRFMVSGGQGWSTTPTQFIIRLRNYGMNAQNNDTTEGSLSWAGETATYKGIRISVSGVQDMVQQAIQQAKTVLYEEMLFAGSQDELPAIPWSSIMDNAADQTIGYSFVSTLIDIRPTSQGWLFRRIWSSEEWRGNFFCADEEGEYPGPTISREAARQYGSLVERFLELMLFLIHISGGQPARAPEILTLRHRNTMNSGTRNVFIDGGLVMIVTGYHKGFSRTERLKVIQRFLPAEIGSLLVHYLWLVLPFWEDILANADDRVKLLPHLWATEEILDRQAAGGNSIGDEDTEPLKRSWISKSGAGPHWTPTRMSRVLRKLSRPACAQGITVSSWRHLSVGITRRFLRSTKVAGQHHDRLDNSDDEQTEDDNSPWDMQAGHGSLTAGRIYGRLIVEGGFETAERRSTFRSISLEWHDLLGLGSAPGSIAGGLGTSRKRKNPSLHHESLRAAQLLRAQQLQRIDIDRELARLYGDETRFRGRQREAIRAIMDNKSPVFLVSGTGSGKSLCFMLPSSSSTGGLTIVVVPLVSLQGDLIRRCDKLGIPCAVWRTDSAYPGAVSIVFVTPESAMTKRFQDYIELQRVTCRLDRFVVDEGHTVLEGSPRFRPKLRELGSLALYGVQMIYLTATLPPPREDELFGLLQTRRRHVTMIRTSTSRANLAYSVETGPANTQGQGSNMVPQLRAVLDEKLRSYCWPAKIIVYCSRVSTTEAVATGLGCHAYHREVDTNDGKSQRLSAWMNNIPRPDLYGSGRVIAATNALGLGIDVPDIRVVLHLGAPRDIVDYAQQSGRAGRDGQRSEAIVMLGKFESQAQKVAADSEPGSLAAFLGGRTCRRVELDLAMDGRKGRVGCEEGEEACDICQGAVPETAMDRTKQVEDELEARLRARDVDVHFAISRANNAAAKEQEELSDLRQILESLRTQGCIFCRVIGLNGQAHDPLLCDVPSQYTGHKRDLVQHVCQVSSVATKVLGRRGGVERYGCCWRCLVPQEICESWEEDSVGGGWRLFRGGQCQYKNLLLPSLVRASTLQSAAFQQTCSSLGFQGDLWSVEMYRWLGTRVLWAGDEATMLCRLAQRVLSGNNHKSRG